ncbi:MAG: hypothetical protein QY322_00115 [bacterium]|nr:MAG: hypothetical protein QY322_00115 [bacterium]
MTNNYIAISSLAMDLKRIALAFHSGSNETGERFIIEANKRKSEIDTTSVKPYLIDHINSLEKSFMYSDKLHLAEDALMYSQIFQNYAVTFEK